MSRTVQFTAPTMIPVPFTAEEMDHINVGCYVKVRNGDIMCWIQIKLLSNNELRGVVLEIINQDAGGVLTIGTEVAFMRGHIVELGCDYLCFS